MNEWNVTLQRSDGEVIEAKYRCQWNPAQDGTADLVARSCAAEHTVFRNERIRNAEGEQVFKWRYAGISATLVAA